MFLARRWFHKPFSVTKLGLNLNYPFNNILKKVDTRTCEFACLPFFISIWTGLIYSTYTVLHVLIFKNIIQINLFENIDEI